MTAQPARIDLADLGPGVAWAFEFDENGRGRLLGGDSSIDLMHGRRFVWVHLILGNVRTREWIGAQDALPPEAREVFLSKDRHPSLHWGGEALWGTLHDVRHEDQTAGMEATDLRFALWPQFLLTARHHAARSAMAVKDQAEKGATFEDSAALFESMLIAAADSIGEAAQQIAGRAGSDRRPRFVGRLERRKRGALAVTERHFSPGATGSGRSQRAGATRTKPRRERPSGVSRPGLQSAAAGRRLSAPTSICRLSARGFCRRKWRRNSRPRPIGTSSPSRSSRPCCCLRPS